jgi:hypothetical protein
VDKLFEIIIGFILGVDSSPSIREWWKVKLLDFGGIKTGKRLGFIYFC